MTIQLPEKPWSVTGRTIESKVRKAIYDYGLLDGSGNRVAVALSGGKDSLTLLFMLHALSGFGFPALDIHAIHVGGPFSCGAGIDNKALKNVCEKIGISYHQQESTQKLETLSCYPCSRERRRLLFDTAKSLGITTIAFGHHQDDSVETGLMNLLHKGEFAGMLPKVPMHDYGVTIIRPLILVEESEIITFAKQVGFARILCACPVGAQSMRRKVKQLLEHIDEIYPNSSSNIALALRTYGSTKALER